MAAVLLSFICIFFGNFFVFILNNVSIFCLSSKMDDPDGLKCLLEISAVRFGLFKDQIYCIMYAAF